MKKLIVLALLAFAGFSTGRLASAQTRQVQGQVPFDFTAGSARLSAGEYRITYDQSGLASFHNLTNGHTVLMFVGADRGVKDGSCKLIFSLYGDQHFLKQSVCSAANVNFFLPAYSREKLARERAAITEDDPQTIVAMK